MRELEHYLPGPEWAAWFIFAIGLFLVIATLIIAIPGLNASTIWYVLVPGTATGLLLTAIGALGVRTLRELQVNPSADSLVIQVTIGIAAGIGLGTAIGNLFGFIAVGATFGCLLGIAVGMAGWLTVRRLTN
jgi:hypothetical protein